METTKKNKENKTRYALLGLLLEGKATGYELKKKMDSSLVYFWSESFGQIYPTLKQMEEEGLVQAEEQPVGDKIRYPYSITNKGRQVLREWLAIPPAAEIIRNELLLKLFFAQPQDKDTVLAHLSQQRLQNQSLQRTFEQLAETLQVSQQAGWIFRSLTLEYGLRAVRAELEWLTYAEREIAKLTMAR